MQIKIMVLFKHTLNYQTTYVYIHQVDYPKNRILGATICFYTGNIPK